MNAISATPSGTPRVRHQKTNVFFNPATLPWTDWVMPNTWFKLLNVDLKTGGFTMLLKVGADTQAPIHHHLGAIEGFMLEGEFGYDADRGSAGWYVWEQTGAIHTPTTTTGFVLYATVYGPLAGYEDDGRVAGLIDAELMLGLARANQAADHIRVPVMYEFQEA